MEKMGHPTLPYVDSKKCCCIIEVHCALSENCQHARYECLSVAGLWDFSLETGEKHSKYHNENNKI